MAKVVRIVGGAGTGKTTELLRLMEKVIATGVAPYDIGFVSFTRAARREASNRAAELFNCSSDDLEQGGWFRTLHSICYQQVRDRGELLSGRKKDAEWVNEHVGGSVSPLVDEEDGEPGFVTIRSSEDSALALWHSCRNRLCSFKEVHERASACDDRVPQYSDCVEIIERYETAKRLYNRCDFTDLLAMFAGYRFGLDGHERCDPIGEVPDVPVWFLDEQQDTSALLDAVCKRVVEPAKWAYIVGDPFQCQPAGTMVLTSTGEYKAIEDLDEETDRLVCFAQRDGRRIFGAQNGGYKFKKASRMVPNSHLRTITAGGRSSVSTFNHKWLAGWTKEAEGKHVVYLMRQGERWRVGKCQLFTKNPGRNGTLRFKQRCRLEKADAGWILSVHDDDLSARIAENIVSAKYGLPTICFEDNTSNGHENHPLSRSSIDAVYAGLNRARQRRNAEACLDDHRRSVYCPFYEPGQAYRKYGISIISQQYACNLLPGLMTLMHVDPGGKNYGHSISYHPVESVRISRTGRTTRVYSMDVEKYHTYVADGIVSHNSIFTFAGSDASLFMGWEVDKEHILPKSYRCPPAILHMGESMLKECSDYWDRGISPSDGKGIVEFTTFNSRWEEEIHPRDSWLLIARSNMHANRLSNRLNRSCIPWHSTKGNNKWSAPKRNMAMSALIALQEGGPITLTEWKAIDSVMPRTVQPIQMFTDMIKDLGHVFGKRIKLINDKISKELTKGASGIALGEQDDKSPYIHPEEMGKMEDMRKVDGLEDWGATPEFIRFIKEGVWCYLTKTGEDYAAAGQRFGTQWFNDTNVRVGTIHSVKGSEADNVLILTTTSKQVEASRQFQDGRDAEWRLAYVGVTRARKRLIVCQEPCLHTMGITDEGIRGFTQVHG